MASIEQLTMTLKFRLQDLLDEVKEAYNNALRKTETKR